MDATYPAIIKSVGCGWSVCDRASEGEICLFLSSLFPFTFVRMLLVPIQTAVFETTPPRFFFQHYETTAGTKREIIFKLILTNGGRKLTGLVGNPWTNYLNT